MSSSPANDVYFLGGADLEMQTIRDLLSAALPADRIRDRQLAWGARTSDYGQDILDILNLGNTAVLIELQDDLGITTGPFANRVVVIDHHGSRAGAERPTALEQVFQRLRRPHSEWSRWFSLVAANDRGHIAAMELLHATADEITQIRAADRRAQGITPEEETSGRIACDQAQTLCHGQLTVVTLPHARTATVTDTLHPALGGPGYHNLLIFSPTATHFFGEGRFINRLAATFPDSYFGGELPMRGFWGVARSLPQAEMLALLKGRE